MIPGWLDEIEQDVTSCMCDRERMSARELADALEISEVSAMHYLYMLAAEGRLAIEMFAVASKDSATRGTSLRPAA